MATVIVNKDKLDLDSVNKDGSKDASETMGSVFQPGAASKLELYRLLVDELIKDEPNKSKVRDYCRLLKIPYSLNATTQIGTVFNRLQSLNRHAINK